MAETSPRSSLGNLAHKTSRLLLTGTALALSGLALQACGSDTKKIPENVAARDALNKYDAMFRQQNPVKRFVLQYLQPTQETIYDYTHDNDFTSPTDYDYKFTVGNGCLSATDYNLSPSAQASGSGRGFLSASSASASVHMTGATH